MKTLLNIFVVFVFFFFALKPIKGNAQTTRKERQATKVAAITKMVNDTNYVFKANYANPMRGGQRVLTSDYDFRVTKDTITAFLPYFGVAHMPPNDPSTNEGGIKFTTTKFLYSVKQKKNGTWTISIKPKDNNITDWRDVHSLTLSVSPDGYADLQVDSSNRDAISFSGEVVAAGKK
jgi:hypothetical protein